MATASNQFGSLIFCSRCGTLLDLPGAEDQLVCSGCGQVEDATGACRLTSLPSTRSLTLGSDCSVRGPGHHDQVEPGRVPVVAAAAQVEPRQGSRRGREEEGLRASGHRCSWPTRATADETLRNASRSTRRARSAARSRCRSRRCSCGLQVRVNQSGRLW